MKILEVKRDWYNRLLKRRELELIIGYESSTPKRDEIRKMVSEQYDAPTERIIVEKLESLFGTLKARAHIHIYDNLEDAKRFERPHILKRHRLMEAEAKKGG